MHNPFDQLGKNVLYDFFVLFGVAMPAAEVPPTDALEIDLWYVPDPAREHLRSQVAVGILREIAAEPAMMELFIQALCDRAFHATLRKRYQWQHVLELRESRDRALSTQLAQSPSTHMFRARFQEKHRGAAAVVFGGSTALLCTFTGSVMRL